MDGVSIIVTYLINAVWLVTVVAAAGWLAALCLKRLGPQAEHIGWVVTLEIAIVAPAAPLLRQLPVLSGNQLFNVGHSSTVTVTATYASAGFGGLYQLPVPALWTITALYFAVVLFCATRFAWLLYATRRMVENAHPLELTPEQKENWNRCKHLFEVDRILLASSAAIHAPVVLELREAILILPDGFAERCTLPDLMTALAHECAHASRRDFKKNLCYEAIALALAFHPAAWAIKAQIAQTREMVCDRMVAERVSIRASYAKSLLAARRHGRRFVAGRHRSRHRNFRCQHSGETNHDDESQNTTSRICCALWPDDFSSVAAGFHMDCGGGKSSRH